MQMWQEYTRVEGYKNTWLREHVHEMTKATWKPERIDKKKWRHLDGFDVE